MLVLFWNARYTHSYIKTQILIRWYIGAEKIEFWKTKGVSKKEMIKRKKALSFHAHTVKEWIFRSNMFSIQIVRNWFCIWENNLYDQDIISQMLPWYDTLSVHGYSTAYLTSPYRKHIQSNPLKRKCVLRPLFVRANTALFLYHPFFHTDHTRSHKIDDVRVIKIYIPSGKRDAVYNRAISYFLLPNCTIS